MLNEFCGKEAFGFLKHLWAYIHIPSNPCMLGTRASIGGGRGGGGGGDASREDASPHFSEWGDSIEIVPPHFSVQKKIRGI